MKKRRFKWNIVAIDHGKNPVPGFEHLPNHQSLTRLTARVKRNIPQTPEKLQETQGKQECNDGKLYPGRRSCFSHKVARLFDVIQHTSHTRFERPATSREAPYCPSP